VSVANLEVTRPAPHVLLLALRRPRRRNALDTALLVALRAELDSATRDDEIRCVVLTGDDQSFSAGADIHEMREGGLAALQNPVRLEAWAAIERFAKPLVAAVNGYALGGGNELALLCDIVVAGASATFGQPEVQIGGMPGDGGTQRLVRAVGKSRAMQMILTGVPIDAPTALACGLVAEVVASERTVARAIEIAAQISKASTAAAQAAKRAVLQAFELPLAEGLQRERHAMWDLTATPERASGLDAFAARSSPSGKTE
jgi:enoyl-CoA hydratase/carnithine racemase